MIGRFPYSIILWMNLGNGTRGRAGLFLFYLDLFVFYLPPLSILYFHSLVILMPWSFLKYFLSLTVVHVLVLSMFSSFLHHSFLFYVVIFILPSPLILFLLSYFSHLFSQCDHLFFLLLDYWSYTWMRALIRLVKSLLKPSPQ